MVREKYLTLLPFLCYRHTAITAWTNCIHNKVEGRLIDPPAESRERVFQVGKNAEI